LCECSWLRTLSSTEIWLRRAVRIFPWSDFNIQTLNDQANINANASRIFPPAFHQRSEDRLSPSYATMYRESGFAHAATRTRGVLATFWRPYNKNRWNELDAVLIGHPFSMN
jgi:hypothetical protein